MNDTDQTDDELGPMIPGHDLGDHSVKCENCGSWETIRDIEVFDGNPYHEDCLPV